MTQRNDELNSSAIEARAREGAFDAQLSFPTAAAAAPPLLAAIIKRDGREVPFETSKIAEAIYRAAESGGECDRNRAEFLASGVAIYLAKHLGGKIPTVDQVSDAVERVLIEFGHADTALAYARYRDKRSRLRELRKGNVRVLLRELEEARLDMRSSAALDSVFVRTSDETVVAWDAERIVEALARETGMDAGRARLIALEVQQQILSAGVKTLTASLVRELVDAKLIEHGYEEHRRRHMRLGVPLFDAEQLICLPNRDESSRPQDPEATDLAVAERVKKEFSLTRVYGEAEGDAHLRGEIHVHDLGFVDRLHSLRASLGYIVRFGIPESGARRYGRPPRHANAFLAQAGRFAAMLRAHCSSEIVWQDVNMYAAPFAADLSDDALRQFVRLLLSGLTSETSRRTGPKTEIEVVWHAPRAFAAIEAPGSDQPYGIFHSAAQRVAHAMLDALDEGGVPEDAPHGPIPAFRVNEDTFATSKGAEFLNRAAAMAWGRGARHRTRSAPPCETVFVFDRQEEPEGQPPAYLDAPCMGQISLNLPRAAYRSGSEAALFDELDRLIAVAARAHRAKREFLERLLAAASFGPLSFLADERDGPPLFALDAAHGRIGLTGLNECVQTLTGAQLHEGGEALALGVRITKRVADLCRTHGAETALRLEPVSAADELPARRFAALDLRAFPEQARSCVKSDPMTHDVFYTRGAQLAPGIDLTPFEQVRIEAALFESFSMAQAICARVPRQDVSAETLAAFIRRAFFHTPTRRLRIET